VKWKEKDETEWPSLFTPDDSALTLIPHAVVQGTASDLLSFYGTNVETERWQELSGCCSELCCSDSPWGCTSYFSALWNAR